MHVEHLSNYSFSQVFELIVDFKIINKTFKTVSYFYLFFDNI